MSLKNQKFIFFDKKTRWKLHFNIVNFYNTVQILIKLSSCMFFEFDRLLTWDPTDCVWGCIFLEGIIIIMPQYAIYG